jgi:hypothetical protein
LRWCRDKPRPEPAAKPEPELDAEEIIAHHKNFHALCTSLSFF